MQFAITTSIKKLLKLTKRLRIIPGGTSAGKTIAILCVLIDQAQRDKMPTLTSVVSESVPHLKRGAIRDFKNVMRAQEYWHTKSWNSTDSIYSFPNGSQIEFFSADNGDKLRGGRRDRLFLNECNNVSFDAFEQLEVRTREFVFMDFNPTNEFWVYTEINGKRTDSELLTLTYLDNEALSPEIVASIEQRKSRKGWWQVYGLGQLGEVEGKIYKDWLVVDEVPHEARLVRYGLDFGYTNDPTAIVAVYSYNGGYIFDEVCFQKGLLNKPIADILDNLDPATVIADSAEPKSIEEIRQYGINILPAVKGKGSIRQGIAFIQQQRISVTRRSSNIIKEYRNYLWKTDANGNVTQETESGFDHSMDAIRYALAGFQITKVNNFMGTRSHLI